MKSLIRDAIALPEKQNITNLDDPNTSVLHSEILKQKVFLHKLYLEYYQIFQESLPSPENASIVELGSGGGFIKDVIPNAITSDILAIPGLDECFSVHDMPFEDTSVDLFCMINTMHHIPVVRTMFEEFVRCLKPGGKVIMIEPGNTCFSRIIYRNFHHEVFDTKADWTIPGGGPLSTGNQALPWIVFKRDRAIFESEFPQLTIKRLQMHTPLRYILSGGFTTRQLLPDCMYTLLSFLDKVLLRPLHGVLGLSMTIYLEKV